MKFEDFAEPEAMYAEATRILDAGIARAGKSFALALSGGTTPVGWFDELESHWSPPPGVKIDVYWVDERQVPFDHPDSNYGNVKRHWPGISALCQHPLTGTYPPHLQLDQVWLGMGLDGHVASWFPEESSWRRSTGSVVAVPAPRHIAPHLPRWTLTPSVVWDAREIILMFTGLEKLALLEEGIAPDAGDDLPVSYLRPVLDRLTVLTAL